MGRQPLSYEDAVKLLGGESKIINALSGVAGAGLAVAGLVGLAHGGVPVAVGLFELKEEIANIGRTAIATMRKRLSGLNRFKRSELLEAAHAILVITAFYEALDDLDEDLASALNTTSMAMTKMQQAASAGVPIRDERKPKWTLLVDALIRPGAIPGLDSGLAPDDNDLIEYYWTMARYVQSFAAGMAVWDQLDDTVRSRWSEGIVDALPRLAFVCYKEKLARLAGEFPEFAFWAQRMGVEAILDELRAVRRDAEEISKGLHATIEVLSAAAKGQDPDQIRSGLVWFYRDQIAKPIAGGFAGANLNQVKLPTLKDLYVTPSYLALPTSWEAREIEQITEEGWEGQPAENDLVAMVVNYLLSTGSAYAPLVLLGQPGAGKSVFTQMLAAELDPRDYLVVRVELRSVPADAGIQEQIEAALTNLTGRSIRWPELADATGDAQPVILLDGFDELLQASGISHFDFLERVQAFQEREAELGRPVGVVVTSRSAVANQVRYPPGTSIARLEEFSEDQIALWLSVWNEANPSRPLAIKTALDREDLVRQPLLLFLFALFHSSGGDLAPDTSQADLFDRLFLSFVQRDVEKLDTNLSDRQRQHMVQRDLDNLSIVAFGMFNRGRQSVTEIELVADLAALQPSDTGQSGPTGRAAALSVADRMAGRFFFRLFMHRDQAVRAQETVFSTYEFLHASFGEFLVARWVFGELVRLRDDARRTVDDAYPRPPDDAKLYALLSFTLLSTREQRVLEFIYELLVKETLAELAELSALIKTLFQKCLRPRIHNPYPQYLPMVQTAPGSYAAFSANLLLLLLIIAEAQASALEEDGAAGIPLSELESLLSGSDSERDGFHSIARLWHSQVTASEWESLLKAMLVRIEDIQGSEKFESQIISWYRNDFREVPAGRILPISDSAAADQRPRIELDSSAGRAFREATLLGANRYVDACTGLLGYISALNIGTKGSNFQLGRPASSVLEILIPSPLSSVRRREALYRAVFDERPPVVASRMILDQLNSEARRFSLTQLAAIAASAQPCAWANINAYLDILAYINDTAHSVEPGDAKGLDLDDLMRQLYPGDAFKPSSPHDIRDMLDLLRLIDPGDLLNVHDLISLNDLARRTKAGHQGQKQVCGLFAMLGVRDLLGLRDLRAALDPSDRIQPMGVPIAEVDEPEEFDDREEYCLLGSWVDPFVLGVILWVRAAQRGLPVQQRPFTLDKINAGKLEEIAPGFIAEIRQLTAQRNSADPFGPI